MELVVEPKIPTIVPVSRNFTPAKGIKIHCVVPSGASRFTVSLQCGSDITRQGDIALQTCFNLASSNATINSRRNDAWDEEVRIPRIPFKCGERFQLAIICGSDCYKIFVNGQQYCEFPQNISYKHITYVAVSGDVNVVQIGCETELVAPTSFGFGHPLASYSEGRFYNDATIPLNYTCSEFQPVSHSKLKHYVAAFGLILVIIILIFCVVFSSKKSNSSYDFD